MMLVFSFTLNDTYLIKITFEMNYENSILVDGKITATENIISNATKFVIAPGATTLSTIIVDWGLSNTYILDLTNMNLLSGGTTAEIRFVRGSSNNVKQRFVIKQNNVAPPNHVAITISAFKDLEMTIADSVEDIAEIEADINLAGKTSILEFDYYDGVYRRISTSYEENNDYDSTTIITSGEDYNTSLSKLDEMLNLLKPADAPYVDDISTNMIFDISTPAKNNWRILSTNAEASNLVFQDPFIYFSAFKAETTGTTKATIDNSEVFEISNSSFDSTLPSTLNDRAMSITKLKHSPFCNTFALTLQLQGIYSPTVKGVYQDIEITSDSRSKAFQFLRCNYPTMITPPVLDSINCNPIPSSSYVCGIPVLRAGDVIETSLMFKDVSYLDSGDGVYGSTIGKLRSTVFNEKIVKTIDVDYASMITTAPDSPLITVVRQIKSGVFQDNVTMVAVNYIEEIGTEGSSSTFAKVNNAIIADSKTNTSLFGIDHTQPLSSVANANKPLVLGGLVQYPRINYSSTWNGTSAQGGLDYSAITNDRYIDLQITVNQMSRIKIQFEEQSGFVNDSIETNAGFDISLKRSDRPSESYKGNNAYAGIGIVDNNEGCLDVAASSKSTKILTFGEVVSTIATIRITLKNTSNHKFGQNIVITTML